MSPLPRAQSTARVRREFGHDPKSEDALPYLIRQVAERLARSLTEALRPFDQSSSVYRILIALARRNPARLMELAELTLIEPSTLSRTVERMEADNLLVRRPDADDARASLASISDNGREFLGDILPAVAAQYQWAIHDVPDSDLEAMRRALKIMLRNLKVSPIK